MKVIAYLAFTLLSILIQFCVMDLNQEKVNLEVTQVQLNGTSHKESFEDLLKAITQKPHALYYRTQRSNKIKELAVSLVQGLDTTTTISTTVVDELYDENSSTTEDTFTTESLYTSTEFDNVTEISFFDKKNKTNVPPKTPKKKVNKECGCNLLYQVCDINCCCDSDCSDSNIKLFGGCKDISKRKDPHSCYPYQYFSEGKQNNIIDNLFCITKTNLPEKRNLKPKYDVTAISHSYKWHKFNQLTHTEFERKPYDYGDPVWVLKEGSIWYIDIPTPTVNSYCIGRKPILFLSNMHVKCIVSKEDLEMFQILKTAKEAPCISVTQKSLNSTALNCSNLHCTNWSILVCDDIRCVDYNKSVHEVSCTEVHCTNIALKIEYLFYCYDAKIVNATIKLYIQKDVKQVPYFNQEISVMFLLTNESIDNITEISGNPGYLFGRPIISSTAEHNRSIHYFNSTSLKTKYISYPSNNNGICGFSITQPELILFGTNKRMKCRFVYKKSVSLNNSTNTCNEIENSIERLLGINEKTHVCPYGNPLDIKDASWVPVKLDLTEKDITYGQFVAKNSKLRCFNMITRVSYVVTFADESEKTSKRENKIVSASLRVNTQNVTFTTEDISVVVNIDINFIDGTKPRMYEYAAGPYISVRLPEDFFFPFRSSGSRLNYYRSVNLISILLSCVLHR